MDTARLPEVDDQSQPPQASPPPLLRRPWVWVVVGLALAAGIGIVLVVMLAGGRAPTRAGAPATSSPGAPPRVPFRFPLGAVTSTSLSGREAAKAADTAAGGVEAALSTFYDQAFVDPAEWTSGARAATWNVFSADVVSRAKRDAPSLTLGPVVGLQKLDVGRTLLEVRVLLDPSLHATAAVGTVTFDATGVLKDGATLTVHNTAKFLLRPEGHGWVIVGYPAATTKVDTSAVPQPGPSGGPSAGPSPSAS